MAKLPNNLVSDLRGAARLAVDATTGITDLVENLHHTIQRGTLPLASRAPERTGGITGLVYGAVRGSMRLVGTGLDLGLGGVARLLPASEESAARSAAVSIANGLYGDHLEASGNPLALPMSLRCGAGFLDPLKPADALPGEASGKILLLVHGLCLNEGHWYRDGHDHGRALGERFAHTVLRLRYNSGRSIAANGRELAGLLDSLCRNWPVPVEELNILGHSMGGLVARSACHHGVEEGYRWTDACRRLVFLGTPHAGAPLEKAGHGLDRLLALTPYSSPFARLGQSRSAGITDLRHGQVTETGTTPALPRSARCYAVAGLLGEAQDRLRAGVVGDGLVPLTSALAQGEADHQKLAIARQHRLVCQNTGHMDLLSSRDVYQRLESWFATPD